jgi:hypothetical protein
MDWDYSDLIIQSESVFDLEEYCNNALLMILYNRIEKIVGDLYLIRRYESDSIFDRQCGRPV